MEAARSLQLQRLRWRSRRGLLEMDLVLERFLPQHLEQLSEEELQAFADLLNESDNDLLDFVNGRAEPEDTVQQRIVAWWRIA